MRCNSDRLPAPPAECTGKGRNRKVVIYKTSNLGNSHPRWKHQWRCLLGHLPSICLLTEFLFMKSVPHSRGQGYRIPRWMVSKWSISSPFSWRPIGGWEKEEHELTVSSLVTRVYFGTVITMASVSSKGYVNRRGNEGGERIQMSKARYHPKPSFKYVHIKLSGILPCNSIPHFHAQRLLETKPTIAWIY